MTFKRKDKHAEHIPRCKGLGKGSAGERAIKQALDDMGYVYQHDKVYAEFKDELGNQRFDFIVFSSEERDMILFMIEYDGRQHFQPTNFGGMSDEQALRAYEKTRRHDNMKNEFCESLGYDLLRIPYCERLANIPQILADFVEDGETQPPQPPRQALRPTEA
jgi:very-short-patch-repair endonuclease